MDFDETFSPVSRMEAIKIFLSYSYFKNFKVYQLDVKYSFLNDELNEEVYAEKPEGFKQPGKEDYVWKLKKDLNGLKQALRAWYVRLDNYLIQQGLKEAMQIVLFISN